MCRFLQSSGSAAGKCRPRPRRLSEPAAWLQSGLCGLTSALGKKFLHGFEVLAFSFKTPRAPKPLLERDGSVSTTFHLSLPPPSATRPQLNFRRVLGQRSMQNKQRSWSTPKQLKHPKLPFLAMPANEMPQILKRLERRAAWKPSWISEPERSERVGSSAFGSF